jgi:formylglycine-generating enzyme required for sulfatase activity
MIGVREGGMARKWGRREARLRAMLNAEIDRVLPGVFRRDPLGIIFGRNRSLTFAEGILAPWRLMSSWRYHAANFGLLALSAMQLVRALAILGTGLGVIFYGLAQIALHDVVLASRVPATTDSHADFTHVMANGLTAVAGADGAARVYRGARLIGLVRGHGAPLAKVAFLDGGAALLTVDASGESRVTQLANLSAVSSLETGAAGQTLYESLWRPFGAPVAKAALFATAQALPLAVPKELRGTRGPVFRDCADCPEMIPLSGGAFFLGSPWFENGRSPDEGPRRLVNVGAFAVGRFEVTFAEYDACVADGGCAQRPNDSGWGRGRRPVTKVSWEDAQSYVRWLSAKTGHGYRLLTEAEWEYAARAGSTTPYWTGATIAESQARYSANKTIEVGAFPANRFGLYDTAGNVWEWVQDCFEGSYSGAPTDIAERDANACSGRVLRGGTWEYGARQLRSANRVGDDPTNRFDYVGFRVARSDHAVAR